MKRILSFEINRDDKAIIVVQGENESNIICMIDTGANLPIYFGDENLLKYAYPEAKKTGDLTFVFGLGKNPHEDVPIWKIPEFEIKDSEGNDIVYHDLLVAVIPDAKASFDLIIPLTMINRMQFSFDYNSSTTHGSFTIKADRKDFYVRPIYAKNHPQYLNKIQVFYQDEEN